MSFDNLYRLEVIGCNKLKHISEATIATTLPPLEYLTVERCNELEQVIVMTGEVAAAATGLVFGRLTTLVVRECGKLKTIFPTYATVPDLKVLELEGNAELEHLFALSDWDCTWQSPYLAVIRLVDCPKMCMSLPTTKEMSNQLQGQENSEELEFIWRRPTQSICLVDLYLIRLIGCNGLKHIYAAAMAASLPNLEVLVVLRCDELERLIVFEDGEEKDPNELICFRKLGAIHVSNCDKLKTIFSIPVSPPRLDYIMKIIWNVPSQNISFSFLAALKVIGCSRLKQVFTATTAMTLHNLEVLWVERCHDLEQVIQEEDGDEDNNLQQFVFRDLEILRLIDLPKLISFSQPSRNLVFTHLREKNLKVEGCPEPITAFFSEQSYNEEEEEDHEDEDNDSKDESYYKTKTSIHALLGAGAMAVT